MLPPTTLKREATSLLDTINAENNGIIDTMREWIGDGWEYTGEPSPAMIAAMMMGEAEDTDELIAQGMDKDFSLEYPIWLRELAYQILDHYHPRPVKV